MQIRIVQTEIEEAIRNHILGQITVKEGVEISISLSATRSDDGFVATIDISNPTSSGNGTPVGSNASTVSNAPASAGAAASPSASTAPTGNAPAAAKTPTIRKAAKPLEASVPGLSPSTNEPAEGGADDSLPAPFDVDDANNAAENAPAKAAEPVAEAPATPAPPKGRSLFGGLTTPTNA